MADDHDSLPAVPALRSIDPPPGGLDTLRTKLDADDARRARWAWIAVPTFALACAAVVAWLLVRPRDEQLAATPDPAATLAARPPPALHDTTISRDPDVLFYWVSSTTSPRTQLATVDLDDVPTLRP